MNISYASGIVTAAAFDPFQYASCVVGPSTTIPASTAAPATTIWASIDSGDSPVCIGQGVYVTSSASNATATVITSTSGSTVTLYGVPTVVPPADWLRAKESQNVQIITSQTSGVDRRSVSFSQVVLATLVTSSVLLF